MCQSLHKNGINKIYVGQDFNNFFSGIPDPDEGKEIFFKKNGFTLNRDRHFDLEADITDNRLIDSFDTSSFDKEFTVASYKDNKKELLGFLEREFPGRWVFEAEEAIAEGKDPESIVILWNQDKTEIVGYCMLSVDDKGYGGLTQRPHVLVRRRSDPQGCRTERGADRRMAHRTPRLTEQPENHGGTPIRPAVVFPQKTVGIASIPQRPH